jgi:ribosomal protein S18 acetylase RimI-like enzyme
MHIRQLNADDALVYWELRLFALRESTTAFASSYEEESAHPLEHRVARFQNETIAPAEVNFMLGAFDEHGSLIGMVGLRREQRIKLRHKATVVGMYVAPAARGQGVGRQLMVELLCQARALEGLRQLDLYVTNDNLSAKGLYASLGFQSYGVEKDALRLGDQFIDDNLMALLL